MLTSRDAGHRSDRRQIVTIQNVDVFLAPTQSTERLRRGVVRHLECKPLEDGGSCLRWRLLQETRSYAQVADGTVFGPVPTIRRPSEGAISLEGNFTDTDLLRLVAYIRSKPMPKLDAGRIGLGVSGTYPIREIARQKNGSVWVLMPLDGSARAQQAVPDKRRAVR